MPRDDFVALLSDAIDVARQIAGALEAAHDRAGGGAVVLRARHERSLALRCPVGEARRALVQKAFTGAWALRNQLALEKVKISVVALVGLVRPQ